MRVVVLKHRSQLLAGSGRSRSVTNVGGTDGFNFDGEGIADNYDDM